MITANDPPVNVLTELAMH